MTADPAHHDSCVVGVDFGTLSGRAVVVRVSDGAELGAAVHDYRHGVMDAELATTGEPLPPDWALQDPADYTDGCARRSRRRWPKPGSIPRGSSASAPTSPRPRRSR